MIISTKTGTIKKPLFDSTIYDTDGDSITTFTVNTIADEVGTSLDGYRVSFSSNTSFVKGDSVLIKETDGILRQNVIEEVGDDVIKLQERLQSFDSGVTITVKPDFVSITLNMSEEGIYYFTDNEALIISTTYFNIQIPFGAVSNRYANLKQDSNMPLMNQEAKYSVFADFSFDPLFFRKLDMGQLRELVLLKMLAILEDELPEDFIKHQTNYDNFKQSVVNILAITEEGEIDPNIIDDPESAYFTMNFTWGE